MAAIFANAAHYIYSRAGGGNPAKAHKSRIGAKHRLTAHSAHMKVRYYPLDIFIVIISCGGDYSTPVIVINTLL